MSSHSQPHLQQSSHASFSGRATLVVEGQHLAILQLNIEGITPPKLDVLSQIATKTQVNVILLQETHKDNNTSLKLPGFTLAGYTKHKHHGLATFVRNNVPWTPVSQSTDDATVEWISTKVAENTIINIYKPPPSRLEPTSIPDVPAPAIYAGDFNCRHIDWGYNTTNEDGSTLTDWASAIDATLLYDPKEPSSFTSGRWNTETNPDLAFSKTHQYEPLPERRVLDRFPRSHHRPLLITTPTLIQPTEGRPVRRWNFRKADWPGFKKEVEASVTALPTPTANNIDDDYEAYTAMLLKAAKKHIPRGQRTNYIPCWDKECEDLLRLHDGATTSEERAAAATALFNRLNTQRQERWEETVESIDFTHSSRRAWQTINKLTGRASKPSPCPVTANSIAAQLIKNGRFPDADKAFTREITVEVRELRTAPSADMNLSGEFTMKEIEAAIKRQKANKAPGPDNIHPEFIIHHGKKAKEWLLQLYSMCLKTSRLPKIWRRAKIIALAKPSKPLEDPKSYRPISLLCVPYKLLERLLHARLEPVVETILPREQAGFRRGKSTTDQVTLLTQDIESAFQAGDKAGITLLDLTAAYDTIWLRGLHLKLLQTIPDRHLVGFIMEMLSNRSFTLHTSDGQRSRLRRLKNGVPQGSVLSPMLFNIYIYDIPTTSAKKYGYADDLAILQTDRQWEMIEDGLTADMTILSRYLTNWRLKLSVGKTMSSVFHLNNREAKRELKVKVNDTTLQFEATPTYLGVKLDRSLTYRQHLKKLTAKVTSRAALIRRLAGTTWGAASKTLRISTQALVFSAAEYCAPVWCRSTHTKSLDAALNIAMRTISGALRATPVNQLPILSSIAPPSVRREAAVLALTRKAKNDEDHLLYTIVSDPPPPVRLKSRNAFAQHAHLLLETIPDTTSKQMWTKSRWMEDWRLADHQRLHRFIADPDNITGAELPRKQWIMLNRLRTGVGRFSATMRDWGLKDSAVCECGHPEQTVTHVIEECPLFRPPNGEQGIVALDDETRTWLAETELQI